MTVPSTIQLIILLSYCSLVQSRLGIIDVIALSEDDARRKFIDTDEHESA
jgi:hypothetical protein